MNSFFPSLDNMNNNEEFISRHIGPNSSETQEMLQSLGVSDFDSLINKTLPENILTKKDFDLKHAQTEHQTLKEIKALAKQNQIYRTYIGMGFHDTITPPVIQRNVFENPGWYTAYTPYQPEISQGRLEALINFQTMCSELTGMDISNASLLDEGTAAAEAMILCRNQIRDKNRKTFFISDDTHPHTIEVIKTRAQHLDINIQIGPVVSTDWSLCFGALLSYPNTYGSIENMSSLIAKIQGNGALVAVAVDLLSLTILKPPGEMGANVVVGNTQRFGVPLGFGGPHAAFMATQDKFKRSLPGRIVGVSVDTKGRKSYRLALQTREQHIRRERASSNICTAQVLLANMASFYAVYHGPQGLIRIAKRIHKLTSALYEGLQSLGFECLHGDFFDTIVLRTVTPSTEKKGQKSNDEIYQEALNKKINLRKVPQGLSISLNETTTSEDISDILEVFSGQKRDLTKLIADASKKIPDDLIRLSTFMTHKVFNSFHSETSMLRYIQKLQNKDLSLTQAMIPLGSCTMKLNATTELIPVSWPEFNKIHPFVPLDQAKGYLQLIKETEQMLATITGFSCVSLQPNAGSQGEFAGLLVIRRYQQEKNQGERNICLIPHSAHGTNPASAVMSGLKVVVIKCDNDGNIDVDDLKNKAQEHKSHLSSLMITYPSTHGVYEETIQNICKIIHDNGGQVYMDGANMNALVGLARLPELGADVCHLNLHKTFAIPHGGGGPGVGPIGVAEHLKNFLPNHGLVPEAGPITGIGSTTSAPWGSASILPISWAYMKMLGGNGLRKATEYAILNANYIAKKLENHYEILYKGKNGMVAHECIIDVRPFKQSAGVTVDDIAKRLIDYSFHAPTMSWPVPGTLMVEPTESEEKKELDRFINAMIRIRKEIQAIEEGVYSREDNVLKNAPHTVEGLIAPSWSHEYPRDEAAYPVPGLRDNKYWAPITRIDNAYGDRNLVCSCPAIEEYETEEYETEEHETK